MLLSYADVADLQNRHNRLNEPDINHIRGRVRYLRARQVAVPRFMYANREIVKRAHAIGIDVSPLSFFRIRLFPNSQFRAGHPRPGATSGGRRTSADLAKDRRKSYYSPL